MNGRRWSYSLQAAVVLFALTACCGLAVLLGERVSARFDLTATRQHRLSDRTRAILDKLDRTATVVVAADFARQPAAVRQRLADVTDALAHGATKVTTRVIDTSSAAGQAGFDALLADLAREDRQEIQDHAAAAAQLITESDGLADRADEVARQLMRLPEAMLPPGSVTPDARSEQLRQAWETQAAQVRVQRDDLRTGVVKAREALGRQNDTAPVPQIDVAAGLLRPRLEAMSASWSGLNDVLDGVARLDSTPAPARQLARETGAMVASGRDRAARLALNLATVADLRILKVVKTITRNRAALIIAGPAATPGPGEGPSVTAVDIDALLDLGVAEPGGASVDQRFRAEELLAAGIAALHPGPRVLVVLFHGAKDKLGPEFRLVRHMVDRLSIRNTEIVEWRAGVDAEPPAAVTRARAEKRPVVYVTLSPEVRSAETALQMSRMGEALKRLIESGESVLLSVNPSTLPSVGSPDPLSAFAETLGVKVDSGRPLLREVATPTGRAVATDLFITDPMCDQPISQSIRGLKTRLYWPIPLRITEPGKPGLAVAPLIRVPASKTLWAESEWQQLRQAVDPMAVVLPRPDSPRDDIGGPEPWVLATAVERDSASLAAPQRVVIVGSNGWFTDLVMGTPVDGRVTIDCPGNIELLEASVAWLAGQDELIKRSAAAEAVPTIPNLSAGQLGALRWGLGALLPLLVLLVGALWRLWRG